MRWPLVFLAAAGASQQRHPSTQYTVVAGALRTAESEKAREQVVIDSQGEEHEVNQTHRPLCAIGDMHGDPNHALSALRLCGAVDEDGRWSGGTMTVVQVGDVFDRGNASLPLQQMLWELREQAAEAGGELKLLLGNHELMNLQGRIHYVHGFSRAGDHRGELAEFGGAKAWQEALHPLHGELGRKIVAHDALAVRGEGACRTLFLHAGLRQRTAAQYEGSVGRINLAIRSQIESGAGELLDPQAFAQSSAPVCMCRVVRPFAFAEHCRGHCKRCTAPCTVASCIAQCIDSLRCSLRSMDRSGGGGTRGLSAPRTPRATSCRRRSMRWAAAWRVWRWATTSCRGSPRAAAVGSSCSTSA